jgi:hypothetical protein
MSVGPSLLVTVKPVIEGCMSMSKVDSILGMRSAGLRPWSPSQSLNGTPASSENSAGGHNNT